MRFQFLGTSAGEQYPAFWCECENCEKARKAGGRNIRRNSCAFLEPDCMIDLTHEACAQAERFNVPIRKIRYLLVTHSHEDHLSPFLLAWRRLDPRISLPPPGDVSGPRFTEIPMLEIFGNSKVIDLLKGCFGEARGFNMNVTEVKPFQSFQAGDMDCLALPANHFDVGGEVRGLNYVVQRDGRCILYALDTGWFLDKTLERVLQFTYDLVVIEGTFGYGAEAEGHMNFRKVLQAYELFREKGVLKDGAHFCVSHVCPHFTPIHDEIAPVMAEKGITVAHDGMILEI